MRNRRAFVAIVCFVAVLVVGRAPHAQQPIQEPEPNAVHWSLAEVLRMALENNLDLISKRKDPAIAEQGVVGTDSKFDGRIGAGATYVDDSTDSTVDAPVLGLITDASSDDDRLTADASWTQLLEFGALYSATYNFADASSASRRVETDSSGQFIQDSLSSNTGHGLTLRWEMPLLQGFGKESNTVEVVLARSGFEISLQDFRLQAILLAQEVENAYWDLLATIAARRVAGESLKLAEDLLVLNRKKVEVGTLAPIEITQAEAGVASEEEGIIVAETAVRNAEDDLRRLLAIPANDPVWSRPIQPTDLPRYEDRTVDVEASLATAMEHRPEVAAAKRRLIDNELSERVAKRGAWHSLDLVGALTPSVFDSDAPLPPPATITDGDAANWLIELRYTVPLGNRKAKSDYAIATLNREKSAIQMQNVEQTVRVDVRKAARNVESGVKRVAAARSNSELQKKTLEAEQKKFDNGMSTTFEVLRIQNDLSDARLREINAILTYTKALVELERVKGTLLDARGLRIQ